MAMTHRIITRSTPLAAIVLLAAIVGGAWAIVEFAPKRAIPPLAPATYLAIPTRPSTAPHAELHVPFAPTAVPGERSECARIADEIYTHYMPLTVGEDVEFHVTRVADLVHAYITNRCPNAIHEGDWDVTAQILGVGLVADAIRPQSAVYVPSLDWHPRSADLVPTAVATFEILAPVTMCDEALLQHELMEKSPALATLLPACHAAFDGR